VHAAQWSELEKWLAVIHVAYEELSEVEQKAMNSCRPKALVEE